MVGDTFGFDKIIENIKNTISQIIRMIFDIYASIPQEVFTAILIISFIMAILFIWWSIKHKESWRHVKY
jgi:hypothetical protein